MQPEICNEKEVEGDREDMRVVHIQNHEEYLCAINTNCLITLWGETFANGNELSLSHQCNYRIAFPSPLMRPLGDFLEDLLHFLVFGIL